MLPLRGLGISGHIPFFLVLQATWALKLDVTSDVVPGETLLVSWISAAGDPDTMDIFLSCGGAPYKMIASAVSTALASYNVTVPASDSPNSPSPLSCILEARAMDDVTLLDKITVDVATPAPTNSESISPPTSTSEPSPTSIVTPEPTSIVTPEPTLIVTPEESPTPSSTSAPTTSSTLESTQTSASLELLSTTSSTDALTSPSSQSSPTEMSASPVQSISSSSGASTDTTATSSRSTSSTISVLPSANSPTQATTKPIGAIIGAIIGGLLGLLILAAVLVLFSCRRRYQRRFLSHRLSLVRDMKPDLSSVPFAEDKEGALLANAEETPYEASNSSASDSEHLGSSSHGHYHDDHQSPYNLDIQLQPMRFSESSSGILAPVLRAGAVDNEEEDWEVQHADHRRSPSTESSKSSTREEDGVLHEAGRSWSFSPHPTGYDKISQSSSESLDIDRMDPEIREQRRDALLERMRRVLDGEQSI